MSRTSDMAGGRQDATESFSRRETPRWGILPRCVDLTQDVRDVIVRLSKCPLISLEGYNAKIRGY
jgi:hypothetical protein